MNQISEVPTRTIMVGDDDLAYRDVGSGSPLLLLQRFRGTIDHWDPAFIAALATGRRVVAFDAPGVGWSTGEPTTSITDMADDAAGIIAALGLGTVDVLGWSMGGMVAQALAITHPELVRRAIFAGTCPPTNPRLATAPEWWLKIAMKPRYDLDDITALFFTDSAASRAAAVASEKRIAAQGDVREVGPAAIQAQGQAMMGYFRDGAKLFAGLADITAPVLVAAGDHDASFPAMNQVVLLESIPSATLAIYPDAGHGFHMQHTAEFCSAVDHFLA